MVSCIPDWMLEKQQHRNAYSCRPKIPNKRLLSLDKGLGKGGIARTLLSSNLSTPIKHHGKMCKRGHGGNGEMLVKGTDFQL